MSEFINRGTGLLLIEAVNSNPNGNPDRENDPRIREDNRGEISSVSVKRKLRDLANAKDGPVWRDIAADLGITDDGFLVFENPLTSLQDAHKLSDDEILSRYWDVRAFGTTILEENVDKRAGKRTFIRTGVVQFGLGISLSPIKIERFTTTKTLAVQVDKTRGMAPLAYRVVPYGLYAMPFFVNATAAYKTRCTKTDIDLLLSLIPYIYTQTASYLRPQVGIRHAFYVEHTKPRGTWNDFAIIDALTPKRLGANDKPAQSWRDYDEDGLKASILELNKATEGRTQKVRDLMVAL